MRNRATRRLLVLTLVVGILSGLYGALSTLSDPGQLGANLALVLVEAAALMGYLRFGPGPINVLAPVVCIAFGLGAVASTWVTLIQLDDPKQMATFTRWIPIFFMTNGMCFRSLGARIVSGTTAAGILVICLIWLLIPGHFDPRAYDTAAVVLTFPVFASGLVAQELAFVVRERRAGQLAATRQSLVDLRRRRGIEAELRTTRENLMRSNRVALVNAITTTISHEINQPIGAVANYIRSARNWLAKDPPNLDKGRDSLANAEKELERAVSVISSIRLLTTRRQHEREPVELGGLLESCLALMRVEFGSHEIAVDLQADSGPLMVFGHRIQLQQVFLNLLHNAVEALDSRAAPRIEVEIRRSDDGQIRVCVADNGPGIPAALLTEIQQGLFTTKVDGTGLGLAICRQIIESHNGVLALETGPQGAAVSVLLPEGATP